MREAVVEVICHLTLLVSGSETPKRLKERFLIGRNRTKRANFRGSPLTQDKLNFFSVFMLYVAWKRGLPRNSARFGLFRPIKKHSLISCVFVGLFFFSERWQSALFQIFLVPCFRMRKSLNARGSGWSLMSVRSMFQNEEKFECKRQWLKSHVFTFNASERGRVSMGEFHPGSDSDVGQHSGFCDAALHRLPDPSDGRQDAAAAGDGLVRRPHSPPTRRGSTVSLRSRRSQNGLWTCGSK